MRPRRFLLIILLLLALFTAALWLTGRLGGAKPDDIEQAGQDVPIAGKIAEETDETPAPSDRSQAPKGEAAIAAAICRAKGDDASGSATLFGHAKQYAAGSGALAPPPAGFGGGNCALVDRSINPALGAMIAAAEADQPGLGKAMVGISCHRSVARQTDLYCAAPRLAARGYAGQAYWVAPPGFSEHATGRSIDFGDRGAPGCNVEPCFAGTAVGRWLAANARRFGFALSFPEGNSAGVAFEPWHYRYVGGWSGEADVPADDDPPAPPVVSPVPPVPPEGSPSFEPPPAPQIATDVPD